MISRNGAGWHHLPDVLEADGDLPWSPEDHKALQGKYAEMLS
jgi:hypothetical protein